MGITKFVNIGGIVLGLVLAVLHYYAVQMGVMAEWFGALGMILGATCSILCLIDLMWIK